MGGTYLEASVGNAVILRGVIWINALMIKGVKRVLQATISIMEDVIHASRG
jgi:hypothetical protein